MNLHTSRLTSVIEAGLSVPADYRLLLEFSVGSHGWFVPSEVREEVHRALQEIVFLRQIRAQYEADKLSAASRAYADAVDREMMKE